MKAKIRIATKEYCFVEYDYEGTPEGALELHNDLYRQFKAENEGLPHLEWNRVLDGYLATNTMDSQDYEKLSPAQQFVVQELKKAFKR